MTSVKTLVSQGLDLYRSGNIAAAAQAYRQALCVDPIDVNALHLLSICQIQLDLLEQALSCFHRMEVIGINHESIESNKKVALQKASDLIIAHIAGTHLDSADSLVRSVLSVDSSNVASIFFFGIDDISRGFAVRGLARLEGIPSEQRRRHPWLDAYNRAIVSAFNHGAQLMNASDPVEATLIFAALAVLEPEHRQVRATLACAIRRTFRVAIERHQSGDLCGAGALYDAIVKADPSNFEAMYLRRLIAARRREELPVALPCPVRAEMPILTICIPTYNRTDELVFQVENLMTQIVESGRTDIRILVSDNGSDVRTEQAVRIFERYNRPGVTLFEYHRNSRNLGYDGNVMACFDRCSSEYLWILSDDDYVMPGAIARLRAIINEHRPTLVFLNEPGDAGGAACDGTLSTPFGKKIRIPLGKAIRVDAKDENLRATVVSYSFWLSRSVFRKNFEEYNSADFSGTSIAHIGLVNLSLLNDANPTFILSEEPMVMNIPHSVFSHNFIEVFVSGIHKLYSSTSMRFSRDIARALARENFRFFENFIDGTHPPHMTMRYKINFLNIIAKKIKYGSSFSEIASFMRNIVRYKRSCPAKSDKLSWKKSTSI